MAASARRPEGKPAQRQQAPARSSRAAPQRARPSAGMRLAQEAGSAVGEFVLRNPLALGSGTAFLVALTFVSANAIWGQSQSHAGAFFPTRALPAAWSGDATTTGAIPTPAAPRPASDPTLRRVQAELGLMGFYSGTLDGLPGPGTRRAIAAFQARNGLEATGELDGKLLRLLEQQSQAAHATTAPDDQAAAAPDGDKVAAEKAAGSRTAKVQAGLKAFGIDGMEVDGIMGARTRSGIREFQKMFDMAETGEPDDALLAKMQETGLLH